MKTYGELYKVVKSGKAVRITSHYGNHRTYFLNEKGVICDQFNVCKPSYTMGELDENDTSEINPLSEITVFNNYDFRSGKGYS